MFSNFGNIFVNRPRHAETSDTRQEIRRHDPDHERKKKKQDEKDQPVGFDEDDNAIVSIGALRVFLENFLQSTESSEEQAPEKPVAPENNVDQKPEPVRPQPASGQAAYAANAYQHSAEANGRHFNTSDEENSISVAQGLGLGASEVRTIHSLLADLKILSERKIEYLQIERSESFLQSLVNAVAKVKV